MKPRLLPIPSIQRTAPRLQTLQASHTTRELRATVCTRCNSTRADMVRLMGEIHIDLDELMADMHATMESLKRRAVDVEVELATQSATLRTMERSLSQRDDVIANLFAQQDVAEERLMRASTTILRSDRGARTDISTCCCCFDTIDTIDTIKRRSPSCCSNGHPMCDACIDAESARHLDDFSMSISDTIPCIAVAECNGVLSPSVLMTTSRGAELVREHHLRCAMPHIVDVLERSYSRNDPVYTQAAGRLAFLRHRGGFRALQCDCGYGPMIPEFCDDLETHHGQQIEPDVKYSNACPMCGTLHQRASEMVPWNGD